MKEEIPNEITFRVDNDKWIRICEKIHDKILVRASKIGKIYVFPDTHRDKTQQIDVEGFVRIKPKRIWNF